MASVKHLFRIQPLLRCIFAYSLHHLFCVAYLLSLRNTLQRAQTTNLGTYACGLLISAYVYAVRQRVPIMHQVLGRYSNSGSNFRIDLAP